LKMFKYSLENKAYCSPLSRLFIVTNINDYDEGNTPNNIQKTQVIN
jgi:hypothetical protein